MFLMLVCILLAMSMMLGCGVNPSPALADIETIDKGEYSGIMTREQLVMESFPGQGTAQQVVIVLEYGE